jgi:hypothetical protein
MEDERGTSGLDGRPGAVRGGACAGMYLAAGSNPATPIATRGMHVERGQEGGARGEHHLGIPVVGRERPAVAEDDRLARAQSL